jgi:hypothetical protein
MNTLTPAIDGWFLDTQDGYDSITWFSTKEKAEMALAEMRDEGFEVPSARIDQIDYHWGKQTMDEVKADPDALEWAETMKANENGDDWYE